MNDSSLNTWWDIARYIGAGGAFVLGVTNYFTWKALREEVTYSKDRDTKTLEVLSNITHLITDMEKGQTRRDGDLAGELKELRITVRELNGLMRDHITKVETWRIPRQKWGGPDGKPEPDSHS